MDTSTPDTELIVSIPLVPVKRTVLFPETLVPFTIGRTRSMAAVEAAMNTEDKALLMVTQRDSEIEEPGFDDLFLIGTKAVLKQMGKTSEGHLQVLAQGIERMVLLKLEQTEPHMMVRARRLPITVESDPELEALHRELLNLIGQLPELLSTQGVSELVSVLRAEKDPLLVAYRLVSLLNLNVERLQGLLEQSDPKEVLRKVYGALAHELHILKLRHEIASQAQAEIGKSQREYFLRQQLKEIQQELGDLETEALDGDVGELKTRIEEADLPEVVLKEATRELKRLIKLPPASPDHQIIRSYLELVLELPWNTVTEDHLDLAHVRSVLDEDHYGIQDVKERILEHLAVLKLNPSAKSPILCLVGPPGVGKTSLGQSIARALERKFERLSLGGLHDEAELRGHRRTYVGAMPGRLIQALRRAGAKNPILMLDEVDKVGQDFRGDPASALLEILDPEQNHTFRDNYLDLPFDLSKVMFITTANSLENISRPLMDRMEIIRLAGYSHQEKFEIANRYLWPRRLQDAGLEEKPLTLEEDVIPHIIKRYTREAGVRQLEQMLGKLTRKVALRLADTLPEDATPALTIYQTELSDWLGIEKYMPEEARKTLPLGVATGLAWTEAGGDVLYVESTLLPGGSDLTITGQLGEVMQESAQAARSYLWSRAESFGLDIAIFKRNGMHIHVPEGAIPKDGPSAGVTMACAMASLLLRIPVRKDTAMTGEISLSGLVLPVGGIKEKLLAAHRIGLRRIMLPKANEKDLPDVPEAVRNELSLIFVATIEEALEAGLTQPVPTNSGNKVVPPASPTPPAQNPVMH
ncbi:MAG: endopeptidase La [Nitrospirota bacterium]|nr:endopeptidase La [Nitrospirota bacterium]MDH5587252.1 endopeptidase La [Nitrospirota bacterium]